MGRKTLLAIDKKLIILLYGAVCVRTRKSLLFLTSDVRLFERVSFEKCTILY